jgi:sugar/nucleoside kinase (ribokinase family)
VDPFPAPVFNGAIGRDTRGDEFAASISDAGVHAALVRKDTPTGTSVILVTPDGERTMNTFLGACRDFQVEDLDLVRLAGSRMLYLTGYLWDTENQRRAAERAAQFAREAGRVITVAFDLADPFAVRRYAELFRAWIPGHVDVLFGNRDELALLTGGACEEDCVSDAAALAPMVVMKMGDKGCMVGWEGRFETVPALPVKAVDTTGAGDAFAAGFLFGRLEGASPVDCARLANAVAARIVSVEGCSYTP